VNCKFQNGSQINSEFIQRCDRNTSVSTEGFPEGITLVRHRQKRRFP